MKNFKNLAAIAAVVIAVVVLSIFTPKSESSFLTAGGGVSLKEANAKAKTEASINVSVEANQINDRTLSQALIIANYRKSYKNGFYVGAFALGGLSTEFGYTVPFLNFCSGWNSNDWNVEYRIGNYARNQIGLVSIDPQFANDITIAGTSASANNAMQFCSTYKKSGTTIAVGTTNGENFYSFGTPYISAYQSLGNFTFGGGVDLGVTTTGFASAKWADSNNTVTLIGNQLGAEKQNFIASYARKFSEAFSLSSSLYSSSVEQRVHLVGSWTPLKGFTTFAQLGGSLLTCNTVTPNIGVGCKYAF